MPLVLAGYLGITTKENREIRETEIAAFRFAVCQAKKFGKLSISAETDQIFPSQSALF